MDGIQFRRYELKHGAHDVFLTWYRQIVPLRERCGFRLLFALDLEEAGEFVSAWAYDGDIADLEARYYSSPDRVRLGDLARTWAIAHGDQGDALTAHPGFTRATHIISARIELTGQLAP
jgi:hypothetical protein